MGCPSAIRFWTIASFLAAIGLGHGAVCANTILATLEQADGKIARATDLKRSLSPDQLSALMALVEHEASFQCGSGACESRAHALAFYIEQKFGARVEKIFIESAAVSPMIVPVFAADAAQVERANAHAAVKLWVRAADGAMNAFVIDYPAFSGPVPYAKWRAYYEQLGMNYKITETDAPVLQPSQSGLSASDQWSRKDSDQARIRLYEIVANAPTAQRQNVYDRETKALLANSPAFTEAFNHPLFRTLWESNRQTRNFSDLANWPHDFEAIRANETVASYLWASEKSPEKRRELSGLFLSPGIYFDSKFGASLRAKAAAALGLNEWPRAASVPEMYKFKRPNTYQLRVSAKNFVPGSFSESATTQTFTPDEVQANLKIKDPLLVQAKALLVLGFPRLNGAQVAGINEALRAPNDIAKYRALLAAGYYPIAAQTLMRSGLLHTSP